jgi:hypothetical protein
MSLADELAAERAEQHGPSRAQLIETARWIAAHPDAPQECVRLIRPLLHELDDQRRRLSAAIKLAAKYREEYWYWIQKAIP